MTHRLAPIVLAGVFAILAFPSPQTVGSDEVRVNNTTYFPAPGLTLRTRVEVVEVPVVVRDSHFQGVAGLEQSDFTLYDSGKKQQITSFSVETFQPHAAAAASVPAPGAPAAAPQAQTPLRFVALCLDDLNTDPESLTRAKKAARQFVETSLAPGDRVAVVTTSWPHDVQFTDNAATMLALIEKVQNHSRISNSVALQCPPITVYDAYLIANRLDDSVLNAKLTEAQQCMKLPADRAGQIDMIIAFATPIWERVLTNDLETMRAIESMVEGMSKIPGRRMILLASSGFLPGNLENEEERLVSKALHAGVVINALGARGVYTVIPFGDAGELRSATRRGLIGPAGAQARQADDQTDNRAQTARDEVLEVLASGTGGAFFHDNNDLLNGLRQVGMVPDVMYVLGFSPTDTVADGRFHALKVQLNAAKHDSVQARKGYYAPSPPRSALAPANPDSRLDQEMQASDTRSELPARLTWASDPRTREVTCTAQIDLNTLKLGTHGDRRTDTLTLVAALRDANGNLLPGQRRDVELNLKRDTLAKLAATGGMKIVITLEAPPGAQAARAVVREGIEGKMVTSSEDLRLR